MRVAICQIAVSCQACWDFIAQFACVLVGRGSKSVVMGKSASVRIAREYRAEGSPAAAMQLELYSRAALLWH